MNMATFIGSTSAIPAQHRDAIEARLAGLDRASLLDVTDTTEVMREAARTSYATRRGNGGR